MAGARRVHYPQHVSGPQQVVDGPCVVLGGGITALGVVRSLGRAGHRVLVVARRGDLAGHSRWVAEHIDDVSEADDPNALVQSLVGHGIGEAVLFPCSDTWAQAVARMNDGYRTRYPTSISPPEVLELLVDKELFSSTLDTFEVPHPLTRPITTAEDIRESELEDHFLKPSNSQRFSALHGDKAYRFESHDQAREGLRLMTSAGVHALLQEYIPGPPDRHYFIDGYLDRDAIARAVFVRRRTRMYPVSFGNSSHMATVPPKSAEPAIDDLLRLLTGIGFQGVFSAEFKHDPRDGAFKLLEVNARPWWYIGFAADCGVDVSTLSYRDALGLKLQTVTEYRTGVQCVLLPLDVRAFLYERRERGLSFASWLRSVVGARSAVFAWDDPRPSVALVAGLAKRSLAVRPMRFRRRHG